MLARTLAANGWMDHHALDWASIRACGHSRPQPMLNHFASHLFFLVLPLIVD